MTIIIIGLGNPGEKYKNTRHNVGFMAIDKFAKENNFPDFVIQKKSNAEISEKPFDLAQGDENIILVKPQTFMNESGKAIKKILENNPATDIIAVHDDIDLPIGKIKVVKERGSAGHKGVESIIQNIGNDGLIRFRIGIKPASVPLSETSAGNTKEIVLEKFSTQEQELIDQTIEKTVNALNLFLKEGLEKTMNEYNK
jgi:PTH1 family peptidyl-tRNA hydrolase